MRESFPQENSIFRAYRESIDKAIFGFLGFSKDNFFSPSFSIACNHSKINLHEKNSSLQRSVECIHMTFTLVPHKVHFTCMDFTFSYDVPHKVYFSYKASTGRPVCHNGPTTKPCVPIELTDPRSNRASRPNRSKVVSNNSTTPARLSSSTVYVRSGSSA